MLKIQLNLNGSFFFSQEIDEDEMIPNCFDIEQRVPRNEDKIEEYITDMKLLFIRQILKAESYEFIVIFRSKINCKKKMKMQN